MIQQGIFFDQILLILNDKNPNNIGNVIKAIASIKELCSSRNFFKLQQEDYFLILNSLVDMLNKIEQFEISCKLADCFKLLAGQLDLEVYEFQFLRGFDFIFRENFSQEFLVSLIFLAGFLDYFRNKRDSKLTRAIIKDNFHANNMQNFVQSLSSLTCQ